MKSEKVAVVGASGYSGQELIRLLSGHSGVELVCVTSRSHAGKTVGTLYPGFLGTRYSSLKFATSDPKSVVASKAGVALLALPHGLASEFAVPLLKAGLRVIDLSADFRIRDEKVYHEFYGEKHPAPQLLKQSVYGMPELYRAQIRGAKLVASPGCYPTSIIIPLHPLLKKRLIDPRSIVIASLSGVSGAGRKAEVDYLFTECNESARPYGLPKHRHLAEIEQELGVAAGEKVVVSFAPHLIPANRGILTTTHVVLSGGVKPTSVGAALNAAYKSEPFVRLLGDRAFPDTKRVNGTNLLDIAWRHDPRTGRVALMSAEDNLVKGASGQAIQSLNIMCGLPEPSGLRQ